MKLSNTARAAGTRMTRPKYRPAMMIAMVTRTATPDRELAAGDSASSRVIPAPEFEGSFNEQT
jgi:hypothetical protein